MGWNTEQEAGRLDSLRTGAILDDENRRLSKHLAELESFNAEQSKELEWYHTLKIERHEGDDDGDGVKAQMLHEMWEENVRLKEKLEYRHGLSIEETGALFGAVPMDAVRQGVELLLRGKQIEKLEAACKKQGKRIAELETWINDLQSGMYINCVYCGHRYGPENDIPATMADVLKEHIEQCPKHPMSALKAECDKLCESKDICPVCMTWSWAPCDEGDEGAEQRGEEWALCQCCNDSRIAVLWKGRVEELREALRVFRNISRDTAKCGCSNCNQEVNSAWRKVEAALGEGGGG